MAHVPGRAILRSNRAEYHAPMSHCPLNGDIWIHTIPLSVMTSRNIHPGHHGVLRYIKLMQEISRLLITKEPNSAARYRESVIVGKKPLLLLTIVH